MLKLLVTAYRSNRSQQLFIKTVLRKISEQTNLFYYIFYYI